MFNLSRLERISILFLVGVLVLGGILHMTRILLTPLPQVPLPVLEREVSQEMPLVPRGLEVPEGEIAPEMIWEETPEIVAKPVFEQFPEAKEVPIPAVETSKVNINIANKEELTALPGIGPVKARAIIDARPYASIDELTKARGIGPKN